MMNKTIVASVAIAAALFSTTTTNAQALEDKLREAQCEASTKAIESAIKNTEHPKKGLKGSTWVKLAEAYTDDATQCGKDSSVSIKAYNTYKKALEVDAAGDGKDKADIEAALSSDKLHAALMSQGAAFYNAQNLGKAFELFKLANNVNPKDTLTTLYAGIVAQQNGDKASAKDFFIKFINQGGKDAAVFYSLALVYQEAKDYDNAIKTLKDGLVLNPTEKDLRGQLVNVYIVSDRIDEAKADLKKLVDADPTNLVNMTNLGILYDQTGDKAEATKIYNQVLAIDPSNYDVNFNLGVVNFNEAVEIKKEVDAMDVKQYQAKGKEIEAKVCEKMKQAKPYFEACSKSPNKEMLVDENLKIIDRIISQCK